MTEALAPQMLALGQRARAAAKDVREASADQRTAALSAMARRLRDAAPAILAANAEDVARARSAGQTEAFIDRLALNAKRLEDIAQGVDAIAAQPDPVGAVLAIAGLLFAAAGLAGLAGWPGVPLFTGTAEMAALADAAHTTVISHLALLITPLLVPR